MNVQETIETRLREALHPGHLEVVNESHMHNVPPGAESHFKVTIVSGVFDGQPRVRRHQAVYRALKEQLAGPVHALAVHAYSSKEWQARGDAPESPRCMGGSGRENTK